MEERSVRRLLEKRSPWRPRRPACRPAPAALVVTLVMAIGGTASAQTVEDDTPAGSSVLRLPETVVEADRPMTAASADEIRARDLELQPRLRPADVLEIVPGLIVVQHAGGGKANQYFLRGFDIDHGTDLALSVDGVPTNMVSHAHGQGYADLHYLIPELVAREEVRKGPYWLEHGDFGTAGAVNLVLRRRLERSVSTSFEGGEQGVRRGLVMLGLPDTYAERYDLDAYVAGEIYTQDGPFNHPEDLWRYNLISKVGREWDGGRVTFTGSGNYGEWNASGQIPLRLVQSDALSRFGSLDPSEGGKTHRYQLYVDTELQPAKAWDLYGLAYVVGYDFDLFSNFTFFRDDPVNGDQIEQVDRDRLLGGLKLEATHHGEVRGFGVDTRLGFQLRGDDIDNELNHTVRRSLLDQRSHNDINQFNYAWYGGWDVAWTRWLRTISGVRLDYLTFNVEDELDDPGAPSSSHGYEDDVVVSPKGSAVVTARPNWDIFLNFGRGFHSNDARGVTAEVDPADPTAAATGAEIGTRFHFVEPVRPVRRVDVATDFFFLDLDSELVFVGDEGTTEPSGSTRRYGFEFETRVQLLDWLWADFDATVSEAFFRHAPSDADDVPLAPRHTLKGGLTAKHRSGLFGYFRARSVSDRPANEDDSLTAEGYAVFDLRAGYTRGVPRVLAGASGATLTVTLDVLNLFDANYREAQFDTASCTRRERNLGVPGCSGASPPGISDIDFTPGWPRTVLAGIKLEF